MLRAVVRATGRASNGASTLTLEVDGADTFSYTVTAGFDRVRELVDLKVKLDTASHRTIPQIIELLVVGERGFLRGSDTSGCWVGGTRARIATIFGDPSLAEGPITPLVLAVLSSARADRYLSDDESGADIAGSLDLASLGAALTGALTSAPSPSHTGRVRTVFHTFRGELTGYDVSVADLRSALRRAHSSARVEPGVSDLAVGIDLGDAYLSPVPDPRNVAEIDTFAPGSDPTDAQIGTALAQCGSR